ncbi:MAG: hypothetical protein CL927_07730 [Deltaproteobacteria bacterium]|nr:hypothetical protein [Deltaproteobacteria bacterium]
MLILTGGTEPGPVQQWITENRQTLDALYGPERAWQPIPSDGIDGLKPGFSILVGAVCPAKAADDAFYAAIHDIPGAYVRTVRVPADPRSCEQAAVKEWYTWRFMPSGDQTCLVYQATIGPMVNSRFGYMGDDPNVIPRARQDTAGNWTLQENTTPVTELYLGQYDLGGGDISCLSDWSSSFSDDRASLVVNLYGGRSRARTFLSFLFDLSEENATVDSTDDGIQGQSIGFGDYEAVYFDGNDLVYVFLDRELGPPSPAAEDPEGKRWVAYNGSLTKLFARWQKTSEVVVPHSHSAQRFPYHEDGGEHYVCLKAKKDGERWIEQEPQLVVSQRGGRPPHCVDAPLPDNTGWRPPVRSLKEVPSQLQPQMDQVSGATEPMTWSWAALSGTGQGDLAVSISAEAGGNLTGRAVAYDGTTVRALADLRGVVTNLQDLGHGRALICTDKGYGLFQGRSGATLWWEEQTICPVALPD